MIILKMPSQIDGLRKSCQIVAHVLKELERNLKPGVTTDYLNQMSEELCFERGGTPAFKGYKGFPYSICACRDSEIVHGFPSNNPLLDGEILSIDFGVIYKGWYGDSAFTAAVGEIPASTKRLLKVGEDCLYAGINAAKVGNRIGDVSNAIQECAEKGSYNVVRQFVGHGVGKNLHEEPQVPNFGSKHEGVMLKEGTVIAIEPMISPGSCEIKTLKDGWTIVTADSTPSVHFEHTIAVTKEGAEILTKRD